MRNFPITEDAMQSIACNIVKAQDKKGGSNEVMYPIFKAKLVEIRSEISEFDDKVIRMAYGRSLRTLSHKKRIIRGADKRWYHKDFPPKAVYVPKNKATVVAVKAKPEPRPQGEYKHSGVIKMTLELVDGQTIDYTWPKPGVVTVIGVTKWRSTNGTSGVNRRRKNTSGKR